MAVPLVNIISTPNNNKTIIIGINQNFLRTFKNPHKSLKNSILIIVSIPFKMVFPDRQLHMYAFVFS